jgi:hypothetical protein
MNTMERPVNKHTPLIPKPYRGLGPLRVREESIDDLSRLIEESLEEIVINHFIKEETRRKS